MFGLGGCCGGARESGGDLKVWQIPSLNEFTHGATLLDPCGLWHLLHSKAISYGEAYKLGTLEPGLHGGKTPLQTCSTGESMMLSR